MENLPNLLSVTAVFLLGQLYHYALSISFFAKVCNYLIMLLVFFFF